MIEETTVDVGGVRTFLRRTGGEGPPTVFVHGNPTHSEDWMPFLERIDGRRSRSISRDGGAQSDRIQPGSTEA